MPVSPHSAAEHLESHQVQADPTINGAINRLDQSVHGLFAKALTTDDYTLTAEEAETAGYLRVSGAFDDDRTLTLPDNNDDGGAPRPKHFIVEHAGSGGFTLTFTTASGSGVVVNQGSVQACYCDGVNVVTVGPANSAGGLPYDFAGFFFGLPGAGITMFSYAVARSCTLPVGLTGSVYTSGVAATASTTFPIKKNGSNVGSLNFAIGATTATFTMASATSLAPGDLLTVVAPGSPDATLADITGTLAATRT